MATEFNRASFPRLFTEGIRQVLLQLQSETQWYYKKFMYEATSSKMMERLYSMYGPKHGALLSSEGGLYNFMELHPGYYVEFEHLTYKGGLRMKREAIDDELYGVVTKFPQMLHNAIRYTIEIIAHVPLNNAWTVNGPDGVPFFSTNHPSESSVGPRSNRPNPDVDLSYDSLQDAIVALKKQKSYSGHPLPWDGGGILVVEPTQLPMVTKLFETQKGEPFTMDNTINFVNRWGLVPHIDPFFTDPDGWAILPKPTEGGFILWIREKPSIRTEIDPANDDHLLKVRMRMSAGHGPDWINSYGSTGI